MCTKKNSCITRTVNQMTPAYQSKRYSWLGPSPKRGFCLPDSAHSSLELYSNETSPLLHYCVSAFQFFVSEGTRTEGKCSTGNSSVVSGRPQELNIGKGSVSFTVISAAPRTVRGT